VSRDDEIQRVYVSRASDIIEALCNLNYLICEDADYPDKVLHYTSMCEERLGAMKRLLEQTENG